MEQDLGKMSKDSLPTLLILKEICQSVADEICFKCDLDRLCLCCFNLKFITSFHVLDFVADW